MALSPIGPIGPSGLGGPAGLGGLGGPSGPSGSSGQTGGVGAPAKGFEQTLQSALNGLDSLQVQADKAAQALADGSVQDVSQAVIAAEKAGLALQLAVHLRDKAVAAYQDIMRMQV